MSKPKSRGRPAEPSSAESRPTESGSTAPPLDIEGVERLLTLHFPQLAAAGKPILIESLTLNGARVRLRTNDSFLRPGGTVSGPAMVMLADVGMYIAILGMKGEAAVDAVTASLSINFLMRPPATDLIAKVELLKLGRRLTVAQAHLYREGETELVAHATASYAMPHSVR